MVGTVADFARAFGTALEDHLRTKGMTQSEAAEQLGLGKNGVARLSTYFNDVKAGKQAGRRATPSAEFLYLVCSKLKFEFEYNGCKISMATLSSNGSRPTKLPEQLPLPFDRQFNLTDDAGTVSISIRRPAGKVEVSVSLKAIS